MVPRSVAEHYRQQQRRAAITIAAVRGEWGRMGGDFDSSWATVGPRVALLVAAAQVGAASDGVEYIGAALAEQDLPAVRQAEIDPRGFVGGWPLGEGGVGSLGDLLYGAVITARSARVGTAAERLLAGRKWLDGVVSTQIADAARQAAGATIAATPHAGWTRMVNPPCCQRCGVLAGKFFRWNRGFQRHPNCDCRHIPTSEANADAVGIKIGPDDVKDLTRAQRQAIDDGADFNQVVNARRGQAGMFTTEGTTRRGWASTVQRDLARQRGEMDAETATNVGRRGAVANYRQRRTSPRPTPEAIYKFAHDRDEAVRLLAVNGYIVDSLNTVRRLAT